MLIKNTLLNANNKATSIDAHTIENKITFNL